MENNNKYKRLLLAIIWTVVIFYFSLKPQSSSSSTLFNIDGMDKVVHFLCYLILTVVWLYFLLPTQDNNKIIFSILISFSLLGIIIELLQGYMDLGRDCDVYDMVANTIGVVVGVWVYRKYFN